MNRQRGLFVLAVLVGAAAVWWAGTQYSRRAPSEIADAPTGEKQTLRFYKNPAAVPALTMHDLDGRPISPADLRGKVTIVNFWATWCPPCRAEIPDLIALQNKYGDRLQVIGISQDEGPVDGVKRFVAAQKMNYPVVMSTPELEQAFPGVRALPTSFILDREGRVVQRHVGLLNADLTELETRALAGLPVNASIEEVERGQPARLENAAQATEIPGVDLKRLSPERRSAAIQKLNTDPCTCGCENTIAKCRIDDPKCETSLPIAQRIVKEIADARP
jgi:cytochrome c biogenesis protein CcmG/thiol:disulfide interchange protein DsbE